MNKGNTIFGHKSRVKWKPIDDKPKVIKRSTQSIINATINQTIDKKKIDVIITSVNYNDFLILSLENNTKYFENITVVTSNDDIICQNICKSYGVKCITTDVFYEDDFLFNKGKAINIGIESIVNPDFILLLDADIIVTNKFDLSNLEPDTLYTSDRWICYNHFQYEKWKKDEILVNNLPKYEKDNGYGFFQLFNFNNSLNVKWYPSKLENSNHPDLRFSSYFPKKQTIDVDIIHLGDVKKNWNGRTSEKFITDEVFYELKYSNENYSFDINSYFDKIYCLNLDRRIDRWAKVKSEFDRLNILVERWSAIDGENLEESNYSQLINEKKSSKLGKIENKFAMACLLSHLSIIKDAKNNGFKKILIFEDDVIFSNDFSEKIKIILKLNWKLLYLGSSQFYWHKIDTSEEFYNCHNTLGTFAYAVDISLFDDIINTFEKKTKSVDNLLSEIQSKHKEECFTIYPNIVISDVEDSDIRQSTNISKYAESMKWDLDMFVENQNFNKNEEYLNIEIIKKSKLKTNQKTILFTINYNDTGGAEYVSYQHIKICRELGYNAIVVSSEKGMFFNKIKSLDVDLYFSNLNNLPKNRILEILDFLTENVDIIYNCNFFYLTEFIQKIKIKKNIEYYTIAHSDIDWVVDEIYKYEKNTDKVIVIHDKIRNELNKKGVSNTKIFTLPNFIDYDELAVKYRNFNNSELRKKYSLNKNDFVIGMISRISPDKNILDSLKIVKMIENSKLLIVGDESNNNESIEYKKEVSRTIKELELENRVIVTGRVENDEIYKYISCFNISINTSPSEGLPISLLETMACGVHCFYPSHGEIPEVLEKFGTVIKLKQKKSFNKKDVDNYIFSRYSDGELMTYVSEIKKWIDDKNPIKKEKISNQIRLNRNTDSFRYYLDFLYGGYKSGISFVIRARNEESNIENCLTQIADIADEIIFVDHLSTDLTFDIAKRVSEKYPNIKVFRYNNEIPRPGNSYHSKIKSVGDSIANYYNFCLSKSTMNTIIKWDADFIPIRENLIEMICKFRLRNRNDKFALWFSGKTMFVKGNEKYINDDSYYDEFRSFSLSNGVFWEDAIRCEYISPDYMKDCIELRFEKPCFYEIKNTEVDEFALRDSLIDKRDIDDFNIINEINKGNIPKNLNNYES